MWGSWGKCKKSDIFLVVSANRNWFGFENKTKKNLAGLDAKYRYTNSHRYTFAHIHKHNLIHSKFRIQVRFFRSFSSKERMLKTHTHKIVWKEKNHNKNKETAQNNFAWEKNSTTKSWFFYFFVNCLLFFPFVLTDFGIAYFHQILRIWIWWINRQNKHFLLASSYNWIHRCSVQFDTNISFFVCCFVLISLRFFRVCLSK